MRFVLKGPWQFIVAVVVACPLGALAASPFSDWGSVGALISCADQTVPPDGSTHKFSVTVECTASPRNSYRIDRCHFIEGSGFDRRTLERIAECDARWYAACRAGPIKLHLGHIGLDVKGHDVWDSPAGDRADDVRGRRLQEKCYSRR
jgi:hypothetical protein